MPATQIQYTVRDVTVRMMRAGSGPPLVYLHGANGLPAWLPAFDTLAEHFEVFVPEHPGFGLSDNPPWLRNIGDLAMYYLDFLESLGTDRVNLVGHSLGGWTAAELAVRNGARVASHTLLAPAGVRVKGIPSGDNFIWGPEEAVRNLYHDQSFADRILAMPTTDEQTDLMLANRYSAAKLGWEPRWFNPSLERWLHRITVPTLVIWGQQDKLFPSEYAKRWGERIAGSRIVVIPDCGHVPAVEKADIVTQEIVRMRGEAR